MHTNNCVNETIILIRVVVNPFQKRTSWTIMYTGTCSDNWSPMFHLKLVLNWNLLTSFINWCFRNRIAIFFVNINESMSLVIYCNKIIMCFMLEHFIYGWRGHNSSFHTKPYFDRKLIKFYLNLFMLTRPMNHIMFNEIYQFVVGCIGTLVDCSSRISYIRYIICFIRILYNKTTFWNSHWNLL